MGVERPALEFAALSKVVAFKLGEELQDPRACNQRRARLSHTVHAITPVLYRASTDERAIEADYLFECGSLAELVRDGFVLHRSPRVVPQVSGRRCSTNPSRTS